ncbi:MAG: ABC transporter substrate-binding protein, partial [Anaerolineae bacterium]|nr:ABC transporter substrate-binding protein [Anaerolineae bacterium]
MVKIGLVAPFEGRYRYISYDAIYAARLAVREINAQGGVGGHYLELVAYDDRGSPELARVAARNLAVDPAVVAVIGHYRQESTAAAQELYIAAQLPLLAVGAYLTRTSPHLWSLMPDPASMAAELVAANPANTHLAALWGAGPLADALRESLSAANYRLVPALSPQQAPPPPETLFSLLPPHETGARWAKWRAAGGDSSLIGSLELASTAFAEIAASQLGEEVHFITPYPLPEDLLGTEDWITAYRAVGPHVPPPGPYALPTYEALYLLAAALTAGPENLAAALPHVTRNGFLGE